MKPVYSPVFTGVAGFSFGKKIIDHEYQTKENKRYENR